MKITRSNEAVAYDAPRHSGMHAYRLQGGDLSPFPAQIGLSIFKPGGGAELSASEMDRVYTVTSGRLTVTVADQEQVLCEYDSCFIPAGEARSILNAGLLPAVVLTIIAKSTSTT